MWRRAFGLWSCFFTSGDGSILSADNVGPPWKCGRERDQAERDRNICSRTGRIDMGKVNKLLEEMTDADIRHLKQLPKMP